MSRCKGWRAVKTDLNYTVEEVARNQAIAKGTVRRWLARGLPSLNERRPRLIKGGDLVDFLKSQRRPKQTCKLEECFCFGCKAPRKAAFGEAEYKPVNATNGHMIALCEQCTTVMHKRISLATLEALKGILVFRIIQANEHIVENELAC